MFLYPAAVLAFLAFLGGSGEPKVDFSAHARGLLGGLLVSLPLAALLARIDPVFSVLHPGLPESPEGDRQAKRRNRAVHAVLLLIPLGLLALSWYLAFSGAV